MKIWLSLVFVLVVILQALCFGGKYEIEGTQFDLRSSSSLSNCHDESENMSVYGLVYNKNTGERLEDVELELESIGMIKGKLFREKEISTGAGCFYFDGQAHEPYDPDFDIDYYLDKGRYLITAKKTGYVDYKYKFEKRMWTIKIEVGLSEINKVSQKNSGIVAQILDGNGGYVADELDVKLYNSKKQVIKHTKRDRYYMKVRYENLESGKYKLVVKLMERGTVKTKIIRLNKNMTQMVYMVFRNI